MQILRYNPFDNDICFKKPPLVESHGAHDRRGKAGASDAVVVADILESAAPEWNSTSCVKNWVGLSKGNGSYTLFPMLIYRLGWLEFLFNHPHEAVCYRVWILPAQLYRKAKKERFTTKRLEVGQPREEEGWLKKNKNNISFTFASTLCLFSCDEVPKGSL